MKNYYEKFHYLADRIGWECPICNEKTLGKKFARVEDLHHYRLHNTRVNRKKYPLLLNSMMNLMPVNNFWHLKYGSYGKTNESDWERRESFLRRHPKICKWLNEPQ